MADSDLKRILILTADAGFGHRSAADAIAAALREVYADGCAVDIVNPLDDRRVPIFLRESQTDYDKLVRKMPELYRFGYETSDTTAISKVIDGALVVMLFEVLADLVRKHRPDVIVTTYPLYQSPLSTYYGVFGKRIPIITVVTDLATVHRVWFHRGCDLCIVPTEAVRALALEYHLPPRKVKVVGIPVNPNFARRDQDKAALRAELGWRADLTTALVVGSKRVRNLRDVLRALNHARLPLQLAIVAGGDEALYNDLAGMEWHTEAHLYRLVKNMPTLMHAADCVVSKAGGLIVSETLATGLPMVLVDVLPGQETGNAEYVVDNDAGEWVQDPLGVLETLYHWLDQDGRLLAEKARNAQHLGRPQAAYDIADLVWEAAARTKPAAQ
ncbi:MAG TPA: glycosyltransferase [Anaerolineae bacterium]|nr:glycosyltransferase [Anaerolineae bacterium]HQI84124.1 glycosyltransferase [Anaerolineae bacterium]